MATYKVLQDIEAEDKLFGPLTLKQFIFAAITILLIYLEFIIITAALPIFIKFPFFLVLLPPILILGFMASPIGRDQPNDVWLLARLRFLFKPRTRIWNQDGLSVLVTITAPKKEVRNFAKSFTQDEVKSRLQALATTMDTRGWAVKNVDTNLYAQPGYLSSDPSSDRLLDPTSIPQEVPALDIRAADDMLDPSSNTTAQNLDKLIKQSSTQLKEHVKSQLSGSPSQQSPTPQDYWFMNQPQVPSMQLPQDYATFASQKVVAPGADDAASGAVATDEEVALAHKIAEEKRQAKSHINDHIKVVQPAGTGQPTPSANPVSTGTDNRIQEANNPAIINLAQNNDLDVATIARQAEKISGQRDDGEVVISLH